MTGTELRVNTQHAFQALNAVTLSRPHTPRPLTLPESDPRLAQIVRRHLDVHLVADANADEILSHFAGDVSENFMTVGQSDPKHGARQNLSHRARQFNWFFLRHLPTNALRYALCHSRIVKAILFGKREKGIGQLAHRISKVPDVL